MRIIQLNNELRAQCSALSVSILAQYQLINKLCNDEQKNEILHIYINEKQATAGWRLH